MRLFALIFGLTLAATQVIFIDAYFRWVGVAWPFAPVIAILLVGVPAAIPLLPEDRMIAFLRRYVWLGPLVAQTQGPLWQVVNLILVCAGATLGYGWPWWQTGLLLLALLILPQLAGELIRRVG